MSGALRSSQLRAPRLLGGAAAATPAAPGPAPQARTDVAVVPTSGGFDLPDPGPCRHQPVLLILLFDNSPSVVGGNDAEGARYAEAALALDLFRRRCSCGREAVALRTFDRRPSRDVGPVALDGQGWPALKRALSDPPWLRQGSSRLRPGLLDAERLAAAHPGHRTELLVFSDFELLDGFPTLVLNRMARFPGHAHALVLTSTPPTRLLALPGVTVSRITADTPPGEVAGAIVTALADRPVGGSRKSPRCWSGAGRPPRRVGPNAKDSSLLADRPQAWSTR